MPTKSTNSANRELSFDCGGAVKRYALGKSGFIAKQAVGKTRCERSRKIPRRRIFGSVHAILGVRRPQNRTPQAIAECGLTERVGKKRVIAEKGLTEREIVRQKRSKKRGNNCHFNKKFRENIKNSIAKDKKICYNVRVNMWTCHTFSGVKKAPQF